MSIIATMLAESDFTGAILFVAVALIAGVSRLVQNATKKATEERDAETAKKLRERREAAQQQQPRKRQPTRKERRVARQSQVAQLDAELAVAATIAEAPAQAESPQTPQPAKRDAPGTKVRLNAKTARQAIIMHEILSPPKAMQQETAMWDR